MAERYSGMVKTYGAQTKYGFITCGDIEQDVYFQHGDLPAVARGNERAIVGQSVQFSLSHAAGGKPQAKHIVFDNPEMLGGSTPSQQYDRTAASGTPVHDGDRMAGQVKCYNGDKGFGFIVSEHAEKDVYFHNKEVPEALKYTLLEGSAVTFEGISTPDGNVQARKLEFTFDGSCTGGNEMMKLLGPDVLRQISQGGGSPQGGEELHGGERCSGEVKSFNAEKGFGFVVSPHVERDVWFGSKDVPLPLQSANLVGSKVTFTAVQLGDGKVQARNAEFTFDSTCRGGGPAASGGASQGWGGGAPKRSADSAGLDLVSLLAGSDSSALVAALLGNAVGGAGAAPAAKRARTFPSSNKEKMQGSIKSLNLQKGFGFISCHSMPGEDIYFKSHFVPPHLQNDNLTGTMLRFTLTNTFGKPQACELEFD